MQYFTPFSNDETKNMGAIGEVTVVAAELQTGVKRLLYTWVANTIIGGDSCVFATTKDNNQETKDEICATIRTLCPGSEIKIDGVYDGEGKLIANATAITCSRGMVVVLTAEQEPVTEYRLEFVIYQAFHTSGRSCKSVYIHNFDGIEIDKAFKREPVELRKSVQARRSFALSALHVASQMSGARVLVTTQLSPRIPQTEAGKYDIARVQNDKLMCSACNHILFLTSETPSRTTVRLKSVRRDDGEPIDILLESKDSVFHELKGEN